MKYYENVYYKEMIIAAIKYFNGPDITVRGYASKKMIALAKEVLS